MTLQAAIDWIGDAWAVLTIWLGIGVETVVAISFLAFVHRQLTYRARVRRALYGVGPWGPRWSERP
jgi:hypothetical protein